MNRRSRKGNSTLEFGFVLLVLVPLFLGTTAIGVNMVIGLQTIQLARDAGHMYARGVHFEMAGNQSLLAFIGANLGLNTTNPSASKAVVILSAVTYVDAATCMAGGHADGECPNKNKWAFTQRLVIGNPSLRGSNLGAPAGVSMDASGNIAVTEYANKSGAVVSYFTGNNPYSAVIDFSQLPSGKKIYVAEASGRGFNLPPITGNARSYSFCMF